MHTQIKCSACGIDLTVDQSSASGVYSCPSCGAHFQIETPQAVQDDSDPLPEPVQKKPTLVIPNLNPGPVHSQRPPMSHPGPSAYNRTALAPKPTDRTIPIIIGSIVALSIVCITIVVINSDKSEPTPAPQVTAKPTRKEILKGIEEKAQEFLDASSPAVERAIEEGKKEQQEFEEEQDRQRVALAEMYGDQFFDGDHDAGYQLILEMEKLFEMMPESEDEAKEFLTERMTKNPVLRSHVAKVDEFPFFDSNRKGPMSFLNQYKSFGTGFFISADGWIVSNRHVVGDATEVDVRMSDGTTHRAKVVKKNEDFDLALIKVEANAPKCLPVSKGDTDLGLGRPVFTIGFPNPMLQGIEPKYTDGKVSATAGLGDDKNFYQVSVPVQPGNSGGALVDADTGWVVGVITLRLENTSDGRSAQNVSYAMKSSALREFVESFSQSDSERIEMVSTEASSPDGVIELAKHSAVQILVPRDASKPAKE